MGGVLSKTRSNSSVKRLRATASEPLKETLKAGLVQPAAHELLPGCHTTHCSGGSPSLPHAALGSLPHSWGQGAALGGKQSACDEVQWRRLHVMHTQRRVRLPMPQVCCLHDVHGQKLVEVLCVQQGVAGLPSL